MFFYPEHFNVSGTALSLHTTSVLRDGLIVLDKDSNGALHTISVNLDIFASLIGRRRDNMDRTVRAWLDHTGRVGTSWSKHRVAVPFSTIRIDEFQKLCKWMVCAQVGEHKQSQALMRVIDAAGPWSGWVPMMSSKEPDTTKSMLQFFSLEAYREDLCFTLPEAPAKVTKEWVIPDGPVPFQQAADMLGCTKKHMLKTLRARHPDFPEDGTIDTMTLTFLALVIGKSLALRVKFFDVLWRRAQQPKIEPHHLGLPDFKDPVAAARAWADAQERELRILADAQHALGNQEGIIENLSTTLTVTQAELAAQTSSADAMRKAIASTVQRGHDIKDLQTSTGDSVIGIEEKITTAAAMRANGKMSLEDFTRNSRAIHSKVEAVLRKHQSELPNVALRTWMFRFVKFCFFRKLLHADGKYVKREEFADDSVVQVRRVRVSDASVVALQAKTGIRQNWRWSFWFSLGALTWLFDNVDGLLQKWESKGFPVHAEPVGVPEGE